jgi:hypothetical protein
MTWQETEDASGVRVDFSGPAASRAAAFIAWAFLGSSIFMFVFMLLVAAYGSLTCLLFLPFVVVGFLATIKMWPHSSRGRLVVTRGRISRGGLGAAIDVASINEIVCVPGEAEYSVNDEPRTVRWFDAIVRTKRGQRVLARFAEKEHATFFCERVCVLAKLPRS